VVDSTNLESDYRRNFVRNELLPMIETRWPGARSALARTRQNLEGARRFYRAKVDEMLTCCDNADFLPNEIVADAPDKVTLLHEFLKRHGISDEIAVEMADSWGSSEGIGKRWLTADAEIVLDREGFRLLPVGQVAAEPTLKIERLAMTDRLMMQIRSDRSQSVCYLPADEIDETKFEENYRLRQPMRGDRIAPIGMKGSSLVSDVLKDAKLTIPERRNYFLLEQVSTGEIIWMPGLKRSRHALVSPTDVAVCRISLDKI
jgi:tRNA(Ile)-lysidine synthase